MIDKSFIWKKKKFNEIHFCSGSCRTPVQNLEISLLHTARLTFIHQPCQFMTTSTLHLNIQTYIGKVYNTWIPFHPKYPDLHRYTIQWIPFHPQYSYLHRYTIHRYPPPSRYLDLHRYTIHGYPLPSQYPDLHRYTIHGYPPSLNIQIYNICIPSISIFAL